MKRLLIGILWVYTATLLQGQSLENLWQMAAQQNPSLRAEFNQYLAALERVDQKKALPDPTVGFGYFISPVETRVGAQRFKLSLSQMFPWMGTLKTKESLAAKQAQIQFTEFTDARNRLFMEVSESWLALSELTQIIEVQKQNLRLLEGYLPIAKTKYESNLTTLADLLRIEIRIEQASTDLELLEMKKKPILSDLNTFLNRSEDLNIDAFYVKNTIDSDSSSLDSALINNPRVKANLLKVESSDLLIELSEQQRKPNIGLGLDYVFVSKRTDMIVNDNGKDIFMPMLSVSLPVFGRKNKAQKREAELIKEGIKIRTSAIENDIKNQWTQAEYLENSSDTQLALYDKEIRNTQSLLNVLTSEYSNNSSNFEELLITQQRLLQLQIAQIKAKTNGQRAIIKKKYLIGTFFIN